MSVACLQSDNEPMEIYGQETHEDIVGRLAYGFFIVPGIMAHLCVCVETGEFHCFKAKDISLRSTTKAHWLRKMEKEMLGIVKAKNLSRLASEMKEQSLTGKPVSECFFTKISIENGLKRVVQLAERAARGKIWLVSIGDEGSLEQSWADDPA